MCPTASFLLVGSFKFNNFKMYAWSVYKHAVAAAFHIYAKCGEDAAKSLMEAVHEIVMDFFLFLIYLFYFATDK